MAHVGDIRLGDTVDLKFTTIDSTGLPVTLAGTPAVAAYPGNSLTEITAGITLTVDFDARTGLHNIRVVATGANGYATATDYVLVLTAGTVAGVSVVGYVVGSFSIEKRSALMPTTAARTLDVTATGEAGIDLDNTVGTLAKTTDITGFNDLSAAQVNAEVDAALDTAIPGVNTANSVNDVLLDQIRPDVSAILVDTGTTLQAEVDGIQADTEDIQARLPVALVAGRIDASVGAMAANVVTAAAIATDAITADKIAAAAITASEAPNLDAAISTRATPAQVNAEVVDALNVDTYAEPAQGAPPATATLVQRLQYLYKAWRNRSTQTASQYTLYGDDALTVDQKATFADDATTADRGEIATGP